MDAKREIRGEGTHGRENKRVNAAEVTATAITLVGGDGGYNKEQVFPRITHRALFLNSVRAAPQHVV